MKKFILFIIVIFTLAMVSSAYAVKCPEPRKTKSAPTSLVKQDKTKKANKANGKKLFNKTAKPIACKMCHGKTGAGDGKLGKVLKPHPRNFTCKATMKKISAGQMFWIIKNGSSESSSKFPTSDFSRSASSNLPSTYGITVLST